MKKLSLLQMSKNSLDQVQQRALLGGGACGCHSLCDPSLCQLALYSYAECNTMIFTENSASIIASVHVATLLDIEG